MRIVKGYDNAWHVVNTSGETVERCHNLATAKMYLNRLKNCGTVRPNRTNSRMF